MYGPMKKMRPLALMILNCRYIKFDQMSLTAHHIMQEGIKKKVDSYDEQFEKR